MLKTHKRVLTIARLDPYGLAGQWLTDSLNASIYTYEVAPVVTLMEQILVKEVLSIFYRNNEEDDGDEEISGDGMFCPGGSYANGTAINLARFWLRPETKVSGAKEEMAMTTTLSFYQFLDCRNYLSRTMESLG